MSVLIVGAGAIGQWLGSLLFERGRVPVSFLVRPRQLGKILPHLEVGQVCQLTPEMQFDDVLFTVKAFQVEEAARQVRESGIKPRRVWGFQNGVGSDELLAGQFPGVWFGAMTTTVPVYLEGDQVRPGPRGGLAWATRHERYLAPEWLHHLGLPCVGVARVDSLKCSKLLLNLTCNASCALLDMLPAEVVSHGPMFRFELSCLREFLAVVRANRIPLVDLPNYPVPQMALLQQLPDFLIRGILGKKIIEARGQKPPSLLVDLRAQRPQSEVDVLNGAVVQLGQRCGVATPGNAWLHTNLNSVVQNPELWAQYRGQIDRVARQALESLKAK